MPQLLLSLLAVLFLSGCATSISPEGRSQLLPPAPLHGFSAVYSEFDMRVQLVTALDAPQCSEAECAADRAFDQRILALGRNLADIAFGLHPELKERFPRFEFIVADKADPGAASSGGGTVVIYRGLRHLDLDDAALAFILAREMSHVIAGHHEENVTTSILVAIAAQILLPILNIAPAATALFSSGAATATAANSAAASTAMTSAASFAGSRALRASYRTQQVREAESLATKLLVAGGWDVREVSDRLQAMRPAAADGEPSWTEELRESTQRLAGLMQGPLLPDDLPDREPLGQIAAEFPSPMVSAPY